MLGRAEWTILVFLNAKNDLEPFAFANFQQMARIGSTREVNVLVQMGRPKHHYTRQFGSWSTTLRFRIEKGIEPIEAHAISDLGATNMGDARALVDFVDWARRTYPATRMMLVIWNHGQGWRAPVEDGMPPLEPAVPHAGHRYVSNDDDTGDKLYNRAIQDALGTFLAGERIDVIAFDACLMAMVETAYALRDVARVMVGSEELEPGSGWNYTRWLEPLIAAHGAIEARDLARLVVHGMKVEYGDTDATTLSAIDLDAVLPLASAISAFSDTAVSLIASDLAAFRAARAACTNYAPGRGLNSIDLGHYMAQIEKGAFPASLKQCAADVRARLHEIVIENYASTRRQGGYGSTGLAIYYPISAAAHAKDPDRDGYEPDNRLFPVEFVQKEQWTAFLHQYWERVP